MCDVYYAMMFLLKIWLAISRSLRFTSGSLYTLDQFHDPTMRILQGGIMTSGSYFLSCSFAVFLDEGLEQPRPNRVLGQSSSTGPMPKSEWFPISQFTSILLLLFSQFLLCLCDLGIFDWFISEFGVYSHSFHRLRFICRWLPSEKT